MKLVDYLKVTVTNRNVVYYTSLFLNLTEQEFYYIQAAWIYVTSVSNEFAPSSLAPILRIINPKVQYLHREYRNNIFKSLEAKGYFKFSFAKTNQERWYTLTGKFNIVIDVIDIFYKLEINKFKELVGKFGGSYGKTNNYAQTKKDIKKFLRVLRKASKKKKK